MPLLPLPLPLPPPPLYLSNGAAQGLFVAFAPSFFGFYAYLGFLEGLDSVSLLPTLPLAPSASGGASPLLGACGSSAGAIAAAVLTTAPPSSLSRLTTNIGSLKLSQVADTYPLPFLFRGGVLRGESFREIMSSQLSSFGTKPVTRIEDALVPLVITVYSLLPSWLRLPGSPSSPSGTLYLSSGDLANAVRASSAFPLLFAPVFWGWESPSGDPMRPRVGASRDWSLLLDGGIGDVHGTGGLTKLYGAHANLGEKRVLHVIMSDGNPAHDWGWTLPSPDELGADQVVTVIIRNLPKVGPLHMENGKAAMQIVKERVGKAIDINMTAIAKNHYVLALDGKQ